MFIYSPIVKWKCDLQKFPQNRDHSPWLQSVNSDKPRRGWTPFEGLPSKILCTYHVHCAQTGAMKKPHLSFDVVKWKFYSWIAPSAICYLYESAYFLIPYTDNQLLHSLCGPSGVTLLILRASNTTTRFCPTFTIWPQDYTRNNLKSEIKNFP